MGIFSDALARFRAPKKKKKHNKTIDPVTGKVIEYVPICPYPEISELIGETGRLHLSCEIDGSEFTTELIWINGNKDFRQGSKDNAPCDFITGTPILSARKLIQHEKAIGGSLHEAQLRRQYESTCAFDVSNMTTTKKMRFSNPNTALIVLSGRMFEDVDGGAASMWKADNGMTLKEIYDLLDKYHKKEQYAMLYEDDE